MKTNKLRVIHLKDIPQGGFAGIVEQQMVISPKFMPQAIERNDISHGLNDFIYLATGHFKAHDGAPLHPHDNVDIVTVVLTGSIAHAGTLGDGTVIDAPNVQVQRAGTGMRHSEINPNDGKADFVQMWFLPPTQNLTPDYRNFSLKDGTLNTVLGGDCDTCFDNNMTCQVGTLRANEQVECEQNFIALITAGDATANGIKVTQGDLLAGDSLDIKANSTLGLILIY